MKVEIVHNEPMKDSCEISEQDEGQEEENVDTSYEPLKDPNENSGMEEGQEREYTEISDRMEEEEVEERGEYEVVNNPDSEVGAADEEEDYVPMQSSHAASPSPEPQLPHRLPPMTSTPPPLPPKTSATPPLPNFPPPRPSKHHESASSMQGSVSTANEEGERVQDDTYYTPMSGQPDYTQEDESIYEPIDTSRPVPPPRRKKKNKLKHLNSLQTSSSCTSSSLPPSSSSSHQCQKQRDRSKTELSKQEQNLSGLFPARPDNYVTLHKKSN